MMILTSSKLLLISHCHSALAMRLRRARGLVREVSFSTRQPEQIMALLKNCST
jgi:hypothetical protein